MDYPYYSIDAEKRKKGERLSDINRGIIHALRKGMCLRKIARRIGCSPSTVLNKLRRGTVRQLFSRTEIICTRTMYNDG